MIRTLPFIPFGIGLGWMTSGASPLAVMASACVIVALFIGAGAVSRALERISL